MRHWVVFIVFTGLLPCCKKEEKPSGGPAPVAVDSVCFANTIMPFITSTCAVPGCHDTGGSGPPFTTYAEVSAFVVPGDTAASPLLTSLVHWPEDSVTVAYMDSVATWIMQGAPNNDCD